MGLSSNLSNGQSFDLAPHYTATHTHCRPPELQRDGHAARPTDVCRSIELGKPLLERFAAFLAAEDNFFFHN
jgi:hypothetical protein